MTAARAALVLGISAAAVAGACRASAPPPGAGVQGLVFAALLAGEREDTVRDVAVDAAGHVFVTGGTASPDFPATPGAAQPGFGGAHDAYVAKLAPDGRLLWASFLGGPHYDRAYAVEVDAAGNPVVAGRAGAGFPTTPGVLQPRFAGDTTRNDLYGAQDGFVAKLSADGGRVLWATYLGSSDEGFVRDLDLDAAGRPVIAMAHRTPPPFVSPGAFQTAIRGGLDGFVARLAADGSRVEWGTFVGGGGDEAGEASVRVASDSIHAVWSTRSADAPTTPGAWQPRSAGAADVLYARLSLDGARLLAATFLGGSGEEVLETHDLALDRDGSAIVTGGTTSRDFPTTEGAAHGRFGRGDAAWPRDGFVARLSGDGTRLLAATYLGGEVGDAPEGVWIGPRGEIGVSGTVVGRGFPGSAPALRGASDAFVVRFSPDLRRRLDVTLLGVEGAGMARTSAPYGPDDLVLGLVGEGGALPGVSPAAVRARSHAGAAQGRDGAVLAVRLQRQQRSVAVKGRAPGRLMADLDGDAVDVGAVGAPGEEERVALADGVLAEQSFHGFRVEAPLLQRHRPAVIHVGVGVVEIDN